MVRAVTSSSRQQLKSHWVDDAVKLEALVDRLRAQPRFALDTESNSMHAYRERICLLQITVPGDPPQDVIIDPLAVDIRPLAPVLEDASVLKVMHGADYDILCFKREYGISIAGLFDTMLAARVLGWPKYGLGAILAERHGFSANKKMQRFDWGRRPLPDHAVDYARFDTHYLLPLHDDQREALSECGRLDQHAHSCLRQTRVQPRPSKAERLGLWRIKGVRKLSPRARAVLAALYELREEVAREIDRPVFRVMGDDILMRLAERPPRDEAALRDLRGVHPRLRDRGRARILAAVERGREASPPRPPPRERGLGRAERERLDRIRAWRKQVAEAEGIEPDIVLGKDAMATVAEAAPTTADALRDCGALDDWELSRYGQQILAAAVG